MVPFSENHSSPIPEFSFEMGGSIGKPEQETFSSPGESDYVMQFTSLAARNT